MSQIRICYFFFSSFLYEAVCPQLTPGCTNVLNPKPQYYNLAHRIWYKTNVSGTTFWGFSLNVAFFYQRIVILVYCRVSLIFCLSLLCLLFLYLFARCCLSVSFINPNCIEGGGRSAPGFLLLKIKVHLTAVITL